MDKNIFFKGLIVFAALTAFIPVQDVRGREIISYVDRSLIGSQKYVLRVDGRPFYMTNIQIRFDKLRYYWGWSERARDAMMARAAADGFNTVSIPIHWYEVEPKKDEFNWSILEEYLGLAQKYKLKIELLWFGQNSGGHVQWLGNPAVNPVHLRTPDYVLYSSAPSSKETTSEYTIRRDISDYSLDLNDNRLRKREAYVLGRVMEHIARWDKANGEKHTVIGVQLNNEVLGKNKVKFPAALRIAYMSELGEAVKNSDYVVWTRMNGVMWDLMPMIEANEELRRSTGTNVDFVGIDLYRITAADIRKWLPYTGGNYRMIMESGAEVTAAAQFQMAALSGNNAYDYYDMCGPDGHGLYDRQGKESFVPHGTYIEDVRIVNKLLNSANTDIALNANGYGLFVHNWSGNSPAPTAGVDNIVFIPASPASQAISIRRSNTEIILMSTKGGSFTLPSSVKIKRAAMGYFDTENHWVDKGRVSWSANKPYVIAGGETILLTLMAPINKTPAVIEQAEAAHMGNGTIKDAAIDCIGFSGNGYLTLAEEESYIRWDNVNGIAGGKREIGVRYANGTEKIHKVTLYVNGTKQEVLLNPTGSWEQYKVVFVPVSLNSGYTNTILLKSTGKDTGSNIDELQVF